MFRHMINPVHAAIGIIFSAAAFMPTALKAAPRPILNERGEEIGLFERVLSRPDAVLVERPGSSAILESPKPFTAYYVFDSVEQSDAAYLQVGPNAQGAPTGWVLQSSSINWPNNLTLAFNEPVVRDRVLFFESAAGPAYLLSDQSKTDARSHDLLERADGGNLRPFDGVLAVESRDFVHWSDKFYLMPVLDFVAGGKQEKPKKRRPVIVETAAIPVIDATSVSSGACAGPQRSAIVFVIDTTLSMQPYIDRTLEMVEDIVVKISTSGLEERVSFALIGFRDKPAPGKNVEYQKKVFAPSGPFVGPADFPELLATMRAAKEETAGFSENGLGGLLAAADLDWSPYRSNWIVYISDASMKTPIIDDRGEKRSVDFIASYLWDTKKIAVASFHLRTPAAKRIGNVSIAEGQFKKLAVGAAESLPYFGIEKGDIDAFGKDIEERADKIVELVTADTKTLAEKSKTKDPIAEIGYAQRLVWLGECSSEGAPDIARGWVADTAAGRSVDKSRQLAAFEPRVLLNRQQMNRIAEALGAVRDAARKGSDSPETFFRRIASVLGLSISDPSLVSTVGSSGNRSDSVASEYDQLGDFLPSYLSRTPYRSDFLTITQDQWVRMSARSRSNWLSRIEAAISTLRIYYNKPESDLYKLHPDAQPSEWFYPVLLSDIP